MKHKFMYVASLVLGIVGAAFHFVPDDAIPEYPALLVNHSESHSPGETNKRLLLIGVADIKPERAGRLQNPLEISENGKKMADILSGGFLQPDSSS